MSLVIYGHHFAVQARLILYFTFLIVKLDSAKKTSGFCLCWKVNCPLSSNKDESQSILLNEALIIEWTDQKWQQI